MEQFIHNKYTKWYFSIIENAKNRTLAGYTEKHHILPKSFGGDDSQSNLVRLTAREHFVCHRLLVKMTEGELKCKMIYAIRRMALKPKIYKASSKTYEDIKKQYSEMLKGRRWSDEVKQKISRSRKGQPSAFKGKTHSDEMKEYLASFKGEKNSRFGRKLSEETKLKMSEAHKGKLLSREDKDARTGVNNPNHKKMWFNDGQQNYFIYENDVKINYVKGRLISWNFTNCKTSLKGSKKTEETREKMRQAKANLDKTNYNKKWFNDGQNNYLIYTSDAKTNYVQGRLISWKTFK